MLSIHCEYITQFVAFVVSTLQESNHAKSVNCIDIAGKRSRNMRTLPRHCG